MATWRPEGWPESLCDGCNNRSDDSYGEFVCDLHCGQHSMQCNFEAGASAMLEALKKRGSRFTSGQNGYVVLVEED